MIGEAIGIIVGVALVAGTYLLHEWGSDCLRERSAKKRPIKVVAQVWGGEIVYTARDYHGSLTVWRNGTDAAKGGRATRDPEPYKRKIRHEFYCVPA